MYFIITHCINFDDFLSVNRIFYKGKTRYVVLLYGIKHGLFYSFYAVVSLNKKIDKRPVKQLMSDFQIKW